MFTVQPIHPESIMSNPQTTTLHDGASVFDSRIYGGIFSTEEMRAVWLDSARIQRYLEIEAALAKAQADLGIIPREAAEEIARHARVEEMDFVRLKAATEHVGYPVLPVVQQLTAACKDGLGQWCHWGATTQDITDTATVLQIRAGLEIVEQGINAVADALVTLAKTYRDTPMIGRSNVQQAIPMTFGYKVAVWLAGIERHRERLAQLKERVLMGEFGGAVGNLASLGSKGLDVQAALMQLLGLKQPPIAWHTVRDTIAEVGCFLGLVCGSLGKIAFDVKIMVATEVGELKEPAGGGGRGASSTMPQKRNPISCAYITACNGVVRQHVAALLSAMEADFERATGTWEIEWIVMPEIFCLTAGALAQASFFLSELEVHPEAMGKNLDSTHGLVCTEAVMMTLAPKMGREKAHDRLSVVCRQVADGKGDLLDLLAGDDEIRKLFDRSKLEALLDPRKYLGLSGIMVDRVLNSRR